MQLRDKFIFIITVILFISSLVEASNVKGFTIVSAKGEILNVANTSEDIPFWNPTNLLIDRNGKIWISGDGGQICTFKDGSWDLIPGSNKKIKSNYGQTIIFDDKNSIIFEDNKKIPIKNLGFIIDIAKDKDSNYWVLMSKGVISISDNKIKFVDSISSKGFYRIATANDNSIFIGSREGFLKLENSKFVKNAIPESIQSSYITALFTSSKGVMWGAGTVKNSNNIFVFSYSEGRFNILKKADINNPGPPYIKAFSEDFWGDVTAFTGMRTWEDEYIEYERYRWEKTKKWDKEKLDSLINYCTQAKRFKIVPLECMIKDQDSICWILGKEELYTLSTKGILMERKPRGGLLSDRIRDIKCVNGKWYIATNDGISIYNREKWNSHVLGTVYNLSVGKKDKVYAMCFDKIYVIKDTICVDTIPFLPEKYKHRDFCTSEPQGVSLLEVNISGEILAVRNNLVYKKHNGYWIAYIIPASKIKSICSIKDDFWVLGDNKLFKLKDNKVTEIKKTPDILLHEINDMTSTEKYGLLIATDHSIFRYRNKNFEEILSPRESTGNISEVKTGVFNDLWFFSSCGPLQRMHLETKEILAVTTGIKDFRAVTYDIDDKGNILIGGKGLVYLEMQYSSLELALQTSFIPSSRIKQAEESFDEESFSAPLKMDWKKEFKDIQKALSAVYKDKIITLIRTVRRDGFLTAISLDSGEELWQTLIPKKEMPDEILTYKDRIFFLGDKVKIFNVSNGNPEEKLSIEAEDMISYKNKVFFLNRDSLYGFLLKPKHLEKFLEIQLKFNENKIFIGEDETIYSFSTPHQEAFDLKGNLKWSESNLFSSSSNPICLENYIISPKGDTIIWFDVEKGKPSYRFISNGEILPDIVRINSDVFFCTEKSSLYCVNTGKEKWKVNVPLFHKKYYGIKDTEIFPVNDSLIYAIKQGKEIYCYDAIDGEQLWLFKDLEEHTTYRPILYKDKIVFISNKRIYVFSN